MFRFIVGRVAVMIPTIFIISIISFVIIQLPPGDYFYAWLAQMQEQGMNFDESILESLRARYGFDQPVIVQYFKWIGHVLQGDLGYSFHYKAPVSSLIGERLLLTLIITIGTLIFTWVVAFPIGVFSAIRQYSIGDYIATFVGFLGLAIPNFMLALILMFLGLKYFGFAVGGLFSMRFVDAAWSWARLVDMLEHIWVPIVVVGTAGTAGLIRIMRANLLDELPKNYVTTARAGGLAEWKVIMKYPVRVALNPFVSTIGWLLPQLISGATITSVVLSLPTTGPMLLQALRSQDMYLAGSFVFILSILTVIGTLISDILLALLDPRIRYRQ
jgi:peptide/nickel transport system permease protein